MIFTMKDAKNLLQEARHEIESLRSINAILAAKVEVLDLFDRVLSVPKRSQGFSEDIAWRIQQALNAIEKQTSGDSGILAEES